MKSSYSSNSPLRLRTSIISYQNHIINLEICFSFKSFVGIKMNSSYSSYSPLRWRSSIIDYQNHVINLKICFSFKPFLSSNNQSKKFLGPPLPKLVSKVLDMTPAAFSITIRGFSQGWGQISSKVKFQQMI